MSDSPSLIRPAIVAVMGHIDHGKSTLLDHIRKSNVASAEAGGITQHLSAYEIAVPYGGVSRGITFLDTPGHAAFAGMRERGAVAADIAILVVAADDGVKAQTIEALHTIRAAGIPFIVAINKVDKPAANIERAKLTLAEHEVLVEGFGGSVPWVAVSAITGAGVEELLETILLVADLEGLSGSPEKRAEGIVIESKLDAKRGVAGTLILKDGTLKKGQFVVAGRALSATRIMENFLGASVDTAFAGTPVQLVGFDALPAVGAAIAVFDKKRDAEDYVEAGVRAETKASVEAVDATAKVVPIILKTDVFGTAEAIERELAAIAIEGLRIKVIARGVGSITEADIRLAQSDKETIIIGFNATLDARARDLNETVGANVQTFSIIYKLTEWLQTELERRRPRKEVREIIGAAKVLKTFSATRERQVLGARMENGTLEVGAKVSVIRRDFPLASGSIIELQQAKQKTRTVSDGECGILIECKTDIAPGDVLEAFVLTQK